MTTTDKPSSHHNHGTEAKSRRRMPLDYAHGRTGRPQTPFHPRHYNSTSLAPVRPQVLGLSSPYEAETPTAMPLLPTSPTPEAQSSPRTNHNTTTLRRQ